MRAQIFLARILNKNLIRIAHGGYPDQIGNHSNTFLELLPAQ